jgi:hypothetical protein
MIPNEKELPDRDFNFIQDRIKFLDTEITRYRDIEWQTTTFHSAIFLALLYVLLDPQKYVLFKDLKLFLIIATIVYAVITIYQLVYIHISLNMRRKERNDQLALINQAPIKRALRLRFYWEGWGTLFSVSFILSILGVAYFVFMLLLKL